MTSIYLIIFALGDLDGMDDWLSDWTKRTTYATADACTG
jgi:hypothetical protein